MSISPAALFYTASVLHAISVPGHILMGFESVYHPINTIKPTKELVVGKIGARNAWDLVTGLLAILALLNFQWARTGGPRSIEEQSILWISVVGGGVAAYRYIKVGAYGTLGCLLVAPLCSAAALLSQSK